MRVKELIEALQSLSEEEKNYEVVYSIDCEIIVDVLSGYSFNLDKPIIELI